MKIVLAPDSLKESICAADAAKCMEIGIRKVFPDAHVVLKPMADGGEGTVQSLVESAKGKYIETVCHDPLMRKIKATYGILNEETAVIELAAASGIQLLKKEERNPLEASSFGTGEILLDAIRNGCKKILIGLGGSAIVDGGAGIVQALGVSLLDKNGKSIPPGGGYLGGIQKIESASVLKTFENIEIIVACDVTNPLTGFNGASYVYGPQKGATPEMVKILDDNLVHYANVIRDQCRIDIADISGIGAGGGVGASLVAFLNAKLTPGFPIISSLTGLEDEIKDADLVITAEGKADLQTLSGKVPYGVGRLGKKYNVPVVLLAGIISEGSEKLLEEGITKIYSIAPETVSVEDSIQNVSSYLQNAIERIIREHFHF